MNIKDYLQDKYTFEEIIILDNYLDNKKIHNTDYFQQLLVDIMKNVEFNDLAHIRLTVKSIIIERLKYALDSIRASADIF